MPPRSTVGVRFIELRGVDLACQDNVASVVGDDGIGVSGRVIDKWFHIFHCLFSCV